MMRTFFEIQSCITNDLFPQKTKKLVCPVKEIAMPIVLLGDAAYPLKTRLLKPYTNCANLTAAQRVFTYRLSRARMTIESTFGRLRADGDDFKKTRCVCRFCQYSCNSMCYHA